ncbi:sensor histidine kinase [Neobacillus sp. PS2-9]|uniref:sensor histidine kinase n=1 Tax=Neobacillus sp. PS2-9 TaxID=3070676 RepID=UPI0027E12F4C|nr:sensor histidine kinase [Neobacillus sp. PS2-9]WML57881.1 sensor histidine kinase [Neobacillus sp. PS2-9]
MVPFQNETHWVYKIAQLTRIGWFILHLLILVLFLNPIPLAWLNMTLLFAAFLIPQWTNSSGRKNYPLLELFFSGLFLIVGCYLLGKYSSFLAIPSLCAGIYSRPGKERWLLWAGFTIVPFLAILAVGLDQLGMGVIDGLFFFGVGMAISKVLEAEKKTKVLLEENRRQNQLLQEYAKQIESITLLEERNRLARDLHDTVGHTFTSVIMGLDAVSFLMDASPQKAKEQVGRLRDVMRRSLEETRTYIHQISPNDDKEELSSQLRKVANEFATHTKTEIIFKSNGAPVAISFQGAIALTRCLQEALTNAVRHGQANEIVVTLNQEVSQVILVIMDNGIGIKEEKFGFGLIGMKERLESLQGSLTIKSGNQVGTVVTCFFPVRVERMRGENLQDDKSIDCG